jgi:hypothetical protein
LTSLLTGALRPQQNYRLPVLVLLVHGQLDHLGDIAASTRASGSPWSTRASPATSRAWRGCAGTLSRLRLQPQGEVLLRRCVQDTTEPAGVPIRAGTPVFVAYAAAMRDPHAVPEPLAFDVGRDEQLSPYLSDGLRAREAPQSRTYLQHGYGRHKCLGRYASEITMRESLRALLRLGRWQRLSPVQLDEQGLYVRSLRVGIVSGRGTRAAAATRGRG